MGSTCRHPLSGPPPENVPYLNKKETHKRWLVEVPMGLNTRQRFPTQAEGTKKQKLKSKRNDGLNIRPFSTAEKKKKPKQGRNRREIAAKSARREVLPYALTRQTQQLGLEGASQLRRCARRPKCRAPGRAAERGECGAPCPAPRACRLRWLWSLQLHRFFFFFFFFSVFVSRFLLVPKERPWVQCFLCFTKKYFFCCCLLLCFYHVLEFWTVSVVA